MGARLGVAVGGPQPGGPRRAVRGLEVAVRGRQERVLVAVSVPLSPAVLVAIFVPVFFPVAVLFPVLVPIPLSVPVSVLVSVPISVLLAVSISVSVSVPVSFSISVSVSVPFSVSVLSLRLGSVWLLARAVVGDIDIAILSGRHGDGPCQGRKAARPKDGERARLRLRFTRGRTQQHHTPKPARWDGCGAVQGVCAGAAKAGSGQRRRVLGV